MIWHDGEQRQFTWVEDTPSVANRDRVSLGGRGLDWKQSTQAPGLDSFYHKSRTESRRNAESLKSKRRTNGKGKQRGCYLEHVPFEPLALPSYVITTSPIRHIDLASTIEPYPSTATSSVPIGLFGKKVRCNPCLLGLRLAADPCSHVRQIAAARGPGKRATRGTLPDHHTFFVTAPSAANPLGVTVQQTGLPDGLSGLTSTDDGRSPTTPVHPHVRPYQTSRSTTSHPASPWPGRRRKIYTIFRQGSRLDSAKEGWRHVSLSCFNHSGLAHCQLWHTPSDS